MWGDWYGSKFSQIVTCLLWTILLYSRVKPVYKDHPKFVVVVDRWSLFRGSFMLWKLKLGPQNSGRYRQVVIIQRWSLTQVWLYTYNTGSQHASSRDTPIWIGVFCWDTNSGALLSYFILGISILKRVYFHNHIIKCLANFVLGR